MYQKIQKLIPLIIVIICIPAAWHLLYPGYFSVHDDMHPAWILEMYRAIQSGQFPPRYAPDLSYGFGYPLFHFIYPLPYYIGAAYYSLGLNLIWSIKLIYILSLPFSALAMYVFTRRHLSTLGAIICSVIYIYTPYRAVNIYVRGALGESLSFVFIPIIFWSIDKAFEIPNKRTISFAGLSFAGLILTHNIAAYIVAPFALIYFVFRFYSHNNLNAIFNLFKMLILGLALSAYFWIPAIIDKRLMIENPIFNYRDHFPFIKQLLFSKWGYGASLWGPDDGFSFQLGIINLISIFLLGLLTLITFYRDKKIIFSSFFTLSSTLFLLYLMNIRSSWIWDTIPFMNYFQFPWRLLLLITFFSSFAAGQIYDQITKHKPNLKV